MNFKKYSLITYFPLHLLVGLHAAALLIGINQLWGINFAKFLPTWWLWTTILIPVLILVPSVSNRLTRHLDIWSEQLFQNRGKRLSFLVLFSIILFAVWIIFRQKAFFLGDGILRINLISNGEFWIPVEMGDFFIHSMVYKYFLEPFGISVAFSYHFISAASGIAFFIGAFQLARYLCPSHLLTILLAMISSGLTVLFFGYVESYSIVAALLPYLILLALKAVDGNAGKTGFIILFIIAGLIHSVIFLILFGTFLIVLMVSRIKSSEQGAVLFKYLGLATVLLIVLLYLARFLELPFAERYLMPFILRDGIGLGLFSLNYIFNIINWILLSGLVAIILFVSNLTSISVKRDIKNYKRLLLSVWLIVPSLLFILLFIPHLGGPRDWDLFALSVFLLVPGAFITYLSKGERVLPVQLMPVIFLSLCIIISFAAVNNSKTLSTQRFSEIIEIGKTGSLFNEYAMLYSFAENNFFTESTKLEYGLKAWQQPGFKKADSIFMANALVRIYINAGEKEQAQYYINHAFNADTADLNTHLLMADYYRQFGTPEDVLGLAARLEDLFSDKAYGLMNAGIIFLKNNFIERGGANLKKAFALDSTDERVVQNYGIYYYQIKNYEQCINLFDRLSDDTPTNFPAYFYKADAYLQLGKIDLARQAIKQAEKLTGSSQQDGMVSNLKQKIYNH